MPSGSSLGPISDINYIRKAFGSLLWNELTVLMFCVMLGLAAGCSRQDFLRQSIVMGRVSVGSVVSMLWFDRGRSMMMVVMLFGASMCRAGVVINACFFCRHAFRSIVRFASNIFFRMKMGTMAV